AGGPLMEMIWPASPENQPTTEFQALFRPSHRPLMMSLPACTSQFQAPEKVPRIWSLRLTTQSTMAPTPSATVVRRALQACCATCVPPSQMSSHASYRKAPTLVMIEITALNAPVTMALMVSQTPETMFLMPSQTMLQLPWRMPPMTWKIPTIALNAFSMMG